MKRMTWKLQEASDRFSEVVDLAMKSGPQFVTKHGKPAVVIVSSTEYRNAFGRKKSLFEALRECPESLWNVIPGSSPETPVISRPK